MEIVREIDGEINNGIDENMITNTGDAGRTGESRSHTYATDAFIKNTIASRTTTRSNSASCPRCGRGSSIVTFCV